MCVSPIRIKNPHYRSKNEKIQGVKDTVSAYISVPCGVCSECLMSRQMQLVQRARTMSLDHYIFFCTLTYNNESLPKVTTSNGIDISYADISDVQNMIKRIRKNDYFGRPFKYFFVTERGTQRGRPHVHGLFFIKKLTTDDKIYPSVLESTLKKVLFEEWRRNYARRISKKTGEFVVDTRNPEYRPLFTFHKKWSNGRIYKNFDVHYVTSHSTKDGMDDVAFYATKYVLKPSNKEIRLQQALRMNLSEDEYNDVWSLVRSRVLCSKFFGASSDVEKNYIKHCIDSSKNDPTGIKYFTQKGLPQPLARYYRKFIDVPSYQSFLSARGGSPIFDDNRSFTDKERSIEKGRIIFEKVRNRDISENFND